MKARFLKISYKATGDVKQESVAEVISELTG